MHNDFGDGLIVGIIVGCILAIAVFGFFSPYGVNGVGLDGVHGDIVIDAKRLGSSMKIEANNLALAERKEWSTKLFSLICEIKAANSRGAEQ